jgi:hypothetical protein
MLLHVADSNTGRSHALTSVSSLVKRPPYEAIVEREKSCFT